MAHTDSLAFPNMFNLTGNQVATYEDLRSVTNRTKLLILTEPTELYNSPDFGVGLKRHLWHYNNANEVALIKDRIVEQLRLHEPCAIPESTSFSDGLLYSESDSAGNLTVDGNHLKLTVAVSTSFGVTEEIKLNPES